MEPLLKPRIRDYPTATKIEWIEADGMGGVAGSTAINANTRKQHCLLSAEFEGDRRIILLSHLQETLVDGNRHLDLSTNAYFGAVHPAGYLFLDEFRPDPWPAWRYSFEDIRLEKQVMMVHGEHTLIVTYELTEASGPMTLIVRPLLAFRMENDLRTERDCFPNNWHGTGEFVECKPFDDGPILYIGHPGARVQTVGLWYRGFLYERDLESRLECCEDLFHPGYLELTLRPGEPSSLVFSTPSPQSVERVPAYRAAERERREAVTHVPGLDPDPFLEGLLRSADSLLFENVAGWPDIHSALPWGEARFYRGLLAFPGFLLSRRRFDVARDYLRGIVERWRTTSTPSKFEPDAVHGHMHTADVPLWAAVAVWRYWKAAEDEEFVCEQLLPLLDEIAGCYLGSGETRCTASGLMEVGHERGADYRPVLPLGTNALWYNALMILAELHDLRGGATGRLWRDRARKMATAFRETFACQSRQGVADQVCLTPFRRDETIRAGQVLAVGLPFCPLEDPRPTVQIIQEHLATPVGLRSLSHRDSRYVGNGDDVRWLPKCWSGSVDATWLGLYHDALHRAGRRPGLPESISGPFLREMALRGYGHISGAFTGDRPHAALDHIASASALGEVIRTYMNCKESKAG